MVFIVEFIFGGYMVLRWFLLCTYRKNITFLNFVLTLKKNTNKKLSLLIICRWILYTYIYYKNIKDFFNFDITSLPSTGFIKGISLNHLNKLNFFFLYISLICDRLNLFQILGILVHRCFTSSQRSRDEIDFLRADFNARMKCLLFNSFANAYYCVYIPACYSQVFNFKIIIFFL